MTQRTAFDEKLFLCHFGTEAKYWILAEILKQSEVNLLK